MITGVVNSDLEATLRLIVFGASGLHKHVDAVIDTEFNGGLTLPPDIIAALGMVWLGREEGLVTGGRPGIFDVYRAAVMWGDKPRPVEVEAIDAMPVVGTALLKDHELRVQMVKGGKVTIASLP